MSKFAQLLGLVRGRQRQVSRRTRNAKLGRNLKFECLERRELLTAVPPTLSLGLLDDTGEVGDFSTSHALIGGQVSAGSPQNAVMVEFDLNGDLIPDTFNFAYEDGLFAVELGAELSYGDHTVYGRAVEQVEDTIDLVFGEWQAFSFRYEPPSHLGQIADLAVDAEGVLTGSVSQDQTLACVLVNLDLNDDGENDAYTFTNEAGNFSYDLSPHLDHGDHTLTVHAETWSEAQGNQFVMSSQTLSFVLQSPATETDGTNGNQDPETAPTFTAQVDANAVLSGTVAGLDPGGSYGIYVEIDYDLDGTPDVYTAADYTGEFSYDMSGDVPAVLQTIQVRVVQSSYMYEEDVVGDWQQITFKYRLAPVIAAFSAEAGLNDVWIFEGFVEYIMPSDLTISFDGILAGHSVTVDADGEFSYATILDDGEATGIVTAQAFDASGRESNIAQDWLI